jgi:tetratricopeptide (TPR) repeat protein
VIKKLPTLGILVALILASVDAGYVSGQDELPAWKKRKLALDRLSCGLSALGRDDQARAGLVFMEAAALDPESPHPRFLGALVKLRLEQHLEALGEMEALEKTFDPIPRAILLAKTHCLRALDRADEADEIDEIAKDVVVVTAEEHLWMGWLFLRPTVEILDGARGEMIAAIKATPGQNPFLPRLTLSCVYQRLGLIDAAFEQASIAARRPEARSAALVHLARLHRLRGDVAGETSALERACLLDRGCSEAATLLAARRMARGEQRDALKLLEVACSPPWARAFWLRALIHRDFGEPEKALADLVRTTALDPTAGLPGRVDPSDRRFQPDAWEKIEKATLAIEAGDAGPVSDLYFRMRGRALLTVGRHLEALADLEQALKLSPGHAEQLRPLILSAMVRVDPERALAAIAKRIDAVYGEEKVVLGRLRLRAVLTQGKWADLADVAADLRRRMKERDHDLELQGIEPGARSRIVLARDMALARLLEARGRIAGGKPAAAAGLVDEVVEKGPFEMRAEALSLRAWLVAGDDEKKARETLAEVRRLHDPTLLFARGNGHPLNGWTARFAAATWRRLGDAEKAKAWFTRAIDEALPTWAEEIVEPAER